MKKDEHITKQLRALSIDIDTITVDPDNANTHNEKNLKTIEESIKRFGQTKPIIVRAANKVIACGNGTYLAMKQLGYKTIAANIVEMTADEAKALAIVDNRSSELSEWDESVLARQLDELSASYDLSSLGFDNLDMTDLNVELSDAEQAKEKLPPSLYDNKKIIEEAFKYYRKTGFPYRDLPVHVCMQHLNKLSQLHGKTLLKTDLCYQVADTYHRHRFHAAAEGKRSPYESFLLDASLKHAITLELENTGKVGTKYIGAMSMVRGTQACSNFRPGYACKLYRDYCKKGSVVLDTSTGYGGRLLGFIASNKAGLYIGIDPNTVTHKANERMAKELLFHDKIELHNMPAEDLDHKVVKGRCDFAFTSPPYFRKEHYSEEETQSWKRYPDKEQWRQGFLLPMMALQFAALKKNRYAIVNINDVKINNENVPLVEYCIEAAEKVGFKYIKRDKFRMTKRFGANMADEIAVEPVLVFKKG